MIRFESPKVTADVVLFSIYNDNLQMLLVKRKNPPFRGQWALPGGFLERKESLLAAARRELFEETGVRHLYLEQLYTFGDPGRDPRGRVVTVAYFALVPSPLSVSAGSDAREAKWWPAGGLPKLAFDHKRIIECALTRLRAKLEYTNVAWSLLPKKFALTDLQKVYELVSGKELDKRNFRKKILSLGLLRPLKERRTGAHQRPARLYAFKTKKKVELKRFFK
ncbi:MAG: hypothetical protein A3B92_03485 [Candidatus Harrisonbacteria bacterium RIFCSPHIGHO2_02_FULL_42_16]|uniref:Nudix hydrolase domain-containing protein n=1 Tax=Candidatus Harrisonbacteria bacterium RIFCSPHIGHO2_02_FULL_42_16 TaxID=1798404 RepID=A0A1G1ZHI6_9BACT|nr:MAG: hypothetical protein A3B92_03485 [Candidatus Harrisonbacteria bacterium RIFCSPHIGHO2_02_FULL_42_16]